MPRSITLWICVFVLFLVGEIESADRQYVGATVKLHNGFSAWRYTANLNQPRGIIRLFDQILVVEAGKNQITLLFDADKDGISNSTERVVIASASGLNHGIAFDSDYLYASSSSTVYRWDYNSSIAAARTPLGTGSVIVHSMPTSGHASRTLTFDSEGRLYISIGSASNVDQDSSRARIVRFSNVTQIPDGGVPWTDGELYADGLRNEIGLRFNQKGEMWGVENGVDNLNRADLGGDIHNTNPGEELNLFPDVNSLNESTPRFYGYPYCWSEDVLNSPLAEGARSQWAHPNFMSDGIHNDSWCKNTSNVIPPTLVFPAHNAPIDIIFYERSDQIHGTFPTHYLDSAFVSLHGSWDRQPPSGYKVVQVNFYLGEPLYWTPFFEYRGPGETGSGYPYRPAGLVWADCGTDFGDCLLFSSDSSNEIVAIAYYTPLPEDGVADDDSERIADLEDQLAWISVLTIIVTILLVLLVLATIILFVVFFFKIRAVAAGQYVSV